MGCKLLAAFVVVAAFLTDNYRSFVDTAPLDPKPAETVPWKIWNLQKKFIYFEEEEEKKWRGPFYFIHGADIQFGLISREIENQRKIIWEVEKVLAKSIVEKINQMSPPPKFFVMCGDLCDAMPNERELRKEQEVDFKLIFGELKKDIPMVCVCGNHDIGNRPTEESVNIYKNSFGDDYYSFWCGGILFLVINSQYFYDASEVPLLAEEHAKWLEEKLNEASNEKKRVIVFQHIPWFLKTVEEENSYYVLNKEIRQFWLDKFKNSGVEGEGKFNDETVKELEDLKRILKGERGPDGELTFSKSQTSFYSDVNGRKSAYKETKNEVNKNGKLVAQVAQKIDLVKDKEGKPKSTSEIEVEIPSKGIHNVIFKNDGNLEVPPVPSKKQDGNNGETLGIENGLDKMNSLSGLEYTPLDMAEYIFWTGDEKGVALTIEEFLEQGLMTRQEAINFLQSIKFNLDFMQAHYQGLQKMDDKVSTKARNLKQELLSEEKPKVDLFEDKPKLLPFDYERPKSDSFDILQKIKQSYEDRPSESLEDYSVKRSKLQSAKKLSKEIPVSDDEFEEILEKLRYVDSVYKVYSLEEVIFRLAKIMFSQSLAKGNKEAQKTLQNFTLYLQDEVKAGDMTRNLEKKISSILITALMETIMEHPELPTTARDELLSITDFYSPSSTLLKQLLIPENEIRASGESNLKDLSSKILSAKEKTPERLMKKVE